jgi:hypothetical protein
MEMSVRLDVQDVLLPESPRYPLKSRLYGVGVVCRFCRSEKSLTEGSFTRYWEDKGNKY